jgi:MraZ protein
MFTGQGSPILDNKKRLTMPVKFRDGLEDGGFVMRGLDHNLMVVSPAKFEIISQRLFEMSLTNPTARLLRRVIFASAEAFTFDKMGRFVIPDHLCQFAGLEGELVLNGMGDYLEIWSPAEWDRQQEKLNDAEANAQLFSTLDLSTSDRLVVPS